MASLQNNMQANIKREITSIYKKSFGKGPECTEVAIFDKFVYLKFIGALSQIEASLMNTEHGKEIVHRIREELISTQASGYAPTIEKIVGSEMKNVTYMMEETKDTLYMFLLFENEIEVS